MHPFKTPITCLLIAFALTACVNQTNNQTDHTSAPPAASIASTPTTTATELPNAQTASQIDFEFTPAINKQIIYFNSHSQAVSQAAAGGYYREIIGQTADGRTVAQDFYQDIGKPQTQPFILQKGADPHDFSATTMDSKGVWFRPDGSLFQMQDFRAGKATSPAWFFENDQVIAQIIESPSQIHFYRNGTQIATFKFNQANSSIAMTYFRADQSKIISFINRNGSIGRVEAWNASGESVPHASIRDEAAPLMERAQQIFAAIGQDNGIVMGEATHASQPNTASSAQ